jgi:glucose-6-phosphate isomerase
MTLRLNLDNTFITPGGVTPQELESLYPQLKAARDRVIADSKAWECGDDVPDSDRPLDAGFHELPNRLLRQEEAEGANSELARIVECADRLAGELDAVVVLGIGGSYMGARALLEGCCHPFYNEVPPTLRQGRPRIYFEGNNVDNDAIQGLIDLLSADSARWGIVVISKSGGTLETAAAFRILLRALEDSLDSAPLGQLVVPVTGTSGKLADLANAIGCRESFPVPDGVGGRFSVLSAVGLLPAALMGLDVKALLQGAADMNEHFATAPMEENIVARFVAAAHGMEQLRGADIRILSTWGKRLEALGLWYDQLLAESLGKHERGAMPLTIVNTRDLHSRGQQHQEGKRDKYITNLIVESCTRSALAIGESDNNEDGLNELAATTIPELLAAAIEGTNQAYREDNRPTADLVLPNLDEYHLGQLFQMFMLATVLEGRLIGINPYGQPGVEAYKRNMNAILRRKRPGK